MNDPLKDAVSALRECTSGEDTGAARFTRGRVLGAVRVQKRHRVVKFTFGLPLVAILMGSAAWAASGHGVFTWIQRASSVFGLSQPTERVPHTANSVHQLPLERIAPPQTAPEAITSSAVVTLPATVDEPTVASKTLTTKPHASATVSQAQPRDSEITERELSLYEVAHRAHFVSRDYGAALAGWNDYLRQVPSGRFALEAKYNRALCLLRLGRNSEAREALAPFSNGSMGGYRKSEAQALVEQLAP